MRPIFFSASVLLPGHLKALRSVMKSVRRIGRGGACAWAVTFDPARHASFAGNRRENEGPRQPPLLVQDNLLKHRTIAKAAAHRHGRHRAWSFGSAPTPRSGEMGLMTGLNGARAHRMPGNSGIRARTMYLRYRDNPRRLGQNAPAETFAFELLLREWLRIPGPARLRPLLAHDNKQHAKHRAVA